MVGRRSTRSRSGQLHTLEGISAAILIVLAVAFASDAVAITGSSGSAASGEVERQYSVAANDLMTQAKTTGELKDAILYWNEDQQSFIGTGGPTYYSGTTPPNEFGRTLRLALEERGLTYNVDLVFKSLNRTVTKRYIRNGAPSYNAVRVSRTIVLNDQDELPSGETLADSNYIGVDAQDVPGLYNLVEVRLTVWSR
jgi:hypothetical protein